VFEIIPYHKNLISRLLGGKLFVDGHALAIRRGVAKVGDNQVTVIVEEALK
jgi:F0F1-type ATP synthase epsilon subunit